MELHPPLLLGLVAIEKVTFGSLSTKVTNFAYISVIKIKHIRYKMRYRIKSQDSLSGLRSTSKLLFYTTDLEFQMSELEFQTYVKRAKYQLTWWS